jgi:hypothetical protein
VLPNGNIPAVFIGTIGRVAPNQAAVAYAILTSEPTANGQATR